MYNAVVVAGEGKKQISLLLGPPQGKFVSDILIGLKMIFTLFTLDEKE
jgi:hypothetical protein